MPLLGAVHDTIGGTIITLHQIVRKNIDEPVQTSVHDYASSISNFLSPNFLSLRVLPLPRYNIYDQHLVRTICSENAVTAAFEVCPLGKTAVFKSFVHSPSRDSLHYFCGALMLRFTL